MLKKILLSTVLAASTLATAQINLDLNVTISHEETHHKATESVVINENETTSVAFKDIQPLIINFFVTKTDENVVIQAQCVQRLENDELLPISEALTAQAPLDQPATFIINEENGTGSLVLVVVPSLVQ